MREQRSVEEICKAEALRIYQARAAERGLAFDLHDDDFNRIIDEPCYYCGAEESRHTTVVSGRSRYTYRHNGVDRVAGGLGYSWANCVACCFRCNRSKGKMDEEDWLDWIERIAIRLRQRHPNRLPPEPETFSGE